MKLKSLFLTTDVFATPLNVPQSSILSPFGARIPPRQWLMGLDRVPWGPSGLFEGLQNPFGGPFGPFMSQFNPFNPPQSVPNVPNLFQSQPPLFNPLSPPGGFQGPLNNVGNIFSGPNRPVFSPAMGQKAPFWANLGHFMSQNTPNGVQSAQPPPVFSNNSPFSNSAHSNGLQTANLAHFNPFNPFQYPQMSQTSPSSSPQMTTTTTPTPTPPSQYLPTPATPHYPYPKLTESSGPYGPYGTRGVTDFRSAGPGFGFNPWANQSTASNEDSPLETRRSELLKNIQEMSQMLKRATGNADKDKDVDPEMSDEDKYDYTGTITDWLNPSDTDTTALRLRLMRRASKVANVEEEILHLITDHYPHLLTEFNDRYNTSWGNDLDSHPSDPPTETTNVPNVPNSVPGIPPSLTHWLRDPRETMPPPDAIGQLLAQPNNGFLSSFITPHQRIQLTRVLVAVKKRLQTLPNPLSIFPYPLDFPFIPSVSSMLNVIAHPLAAVGMSQNMMSQYPIHSTYVQNSGGLEEALDEAEWGTTPSPFPSELHETLFTRTWGHIIHRLEDIRRTNNVAALRDGLVSIVSTIQSTFEDFRTTLPELPTLQALNLNVEPNQLNWREVVNSLRSYTIDVVNALASLPFASLPDPSQQPSQPISLMGAEVRGAIVEAAAGALDRVEAAMDDISQLRDEISSASTVGDLVSVGANVSEAILDAILDRVDRIHYRIISSAPVQNVMDLPLIGSQLLGFGNSASDPEFKPLGHPILEYIDEIPQKPTVLMQRLGLANIADCAFYHSLLPPMGSSSSSMSQKRILSETVPPTDPSETSNNVPILKSEKWVREGLNFEMSQNTTHVNGEVETEIKINPEAPISISRTENLEMEVDGDVPIPLTKQAADLVSNISPDWATKMEAIGEYVNNIMGYGVVGDLANVGNAFNVDVGVGVGGMEGVGGIGSGQKTYSDFMLFGDIVGNDYLYGNGEPVHRLSPGSLRLSNSHTSDKRVLNEDVKADDQMPGLPDVGEVFRKLTDYSMLRRSCMWSELRTRLISDTTTSPLDYFYGMGISSNIVKANLSERIETLIDTIERNRMILRDI